MVTEWYIDLVHQVLPDHLNILNKSEHSEQTHRKTKRKTPTKKKVAQGDKLIKLPSF